jgi:hypothetical protein
MPQNRRRPEEIIARLREAEVVLGESGTDAGLTQRDDSARVARGFR